MTFLAILCAIVFLVSIPMLYDFSKITRAMQASSAESDRLKKALEEAQERGNEKEIADAESAYNLSLGKGCVGCLSGCFVILTGVVISIVQIFLELVIIIWALSAGVGIPALGYIALVAWIAMRVYSWWLAPKQIAKEQKEAEAIGNKYIPRPTNILVKVLGFIPDLYALYIFLVIIGVLTTSIG